MRILPLLALGIAAHIAAAAPQDPAPDDSFSLKILGITYYMIARFDDAAKTLSRAIELAPDDAQAHGHLGLVFSRKGWREAIEREMRKAIELDPSFQVFPPPTTNFARPKPPEKMQSTPETKRP
jgi:Flp pilus assembly protein TadD